MAATDPKLKNNITMIVQQKTLRFFKFIRSMEIFFRMYLLKLSTSRRRQSVRKTNQNKTLLSSTYSQVQVIKIFS